MELISRTDPWFRVAVAVLVVLEAVVLGGLAVGRHTKAHAQIQTPVVAAPLAAPVAATPAAPPATPVVPAPSNTTIHTERGSIGPISIGMRPAIATRLLHEAPTVLQLPRGGSSSRFQWLYEQTGMTIAGSRGHIDTIRVGNTGHGGSFHTSSGVGVGTLMKEVPRNYVYAMRMCSSEWWVQAKGMTLRIAGGRRATSVELTSRKFANNFGTCALISGG